MPRSNIEKMIAQGRKTEKGFVVPRQYDANGWRDFGRADRTFLANLWFSSLDRRDWQIIEKVREREGTDWNQVVYRRSKGDDGNEAPSVRYWTR